MSRSFLILRWLMVMPSAIAGWYCGILAGLVIAEIAERTCPDEYIVSGSCLAPWSQSVFIAATVVGAAIAGAMIVLLSAAMAPAWKFRVALIAFALGFAVATYMATLTQSWLAYAVAVAGGLLALGIVRSRVEKRRKSRAKILEVC
jgi:hypothetical protein